LESTAAYRFRHRQKRHEISQRPNQVLGELIKAKRQAKGLSQSDVAKALGYASPQYVSDWERGYSGVPMKKLVALARLLDIDQDELFDLLLDFSQQRLAADLKAEYQELRARKRRS
jgi:transcriptional regulator with XRE-family HTH domain